jgi:glycosyltransferase involved in cell wall biosynthesis
LRFEGAVVLPWHGDPARLLGQADLLRVPRADISIYMHQVRPLRPGRSVTFVYDTIPLHVEARRVVRLAKAAFLKTVCRLSAAIITISAQSMEAISRDLTVPHSKIIAVTLSVDAHRIARIRAMRAVTDRSETLVYIGRFATHKNLERLCRAFGATDFRERGGQLVLVGGSPPEVARMTTWITQHGMTSVEVRGYLSEPELDRVLATSRALIQPSLEEGYGLPAVEAAAAGLQVAASRTGFAPQIPVELVTFLDPLDEQSMASAIDTAVSRPEPEIVFLPRSTLLDGLLEAIGAVLALRERSVDRARR